MKEWRAPLLGQLPPAETGYDMLSLTVECMTMVVRVCFCVSLHKCMLLFFFFFLWKKRGSFNLTKTCSVWVFRDITASLTHTHTQACHLYLVSDPHIQSLSPHTDVRARACPPCTLRLNTGLFVRPVGLVRADGEQIWSTWVSELWSRKWFLPWFGDEPRSCHPVIRQIPMKWSAPDSSFLPRQSDKKHFVIVLIWAAVLLTYHASVI